MYSALLFLAVTVVDTFICIDLLLLMMFSVRIKFDDVTTLYSTGTNASRGVFCFFKNFLAGLIDGMLCHSFDHILLITNSVVSGIIRISKTAINRLLP